MSKELTQKATRRGRPVKDATLKKRTMIRMSLEDDRAFAIECKRLEAITGQKWSVAEYLRLAGRTFLGKHLTP